jgi:hypothetical protein
VSSPSSSSSIDAQSPSRCWPVPGCASHRPACHSSTSIGTCLNRSSC